jgi:hypothetical protein
MSEYELKRAINSAVKGLREDLQRNEQSRLNDQKALMGAFNRMTEALTALTGEIRALREDLGPQKLDKTRLPGSRPVEAPANVPDFNIDGTG